jgi:DNA-binding CsgD family transcriptional regulator
MGDELRAAIVDEQGCWGSFELFRASDDPAFDEHDAELIRDAGRILAGALRHRAVTPEGEAGVCPDQAGVLLIDDHLRPRGLTHRAGEWFALLDAQLQPEATPLPIHVYELVGRLLAAEAGEDPGRRPRVRVRTSHGRWAMVEAARVEDVANTIAVSVRAADAEDVLQLVSRAYGLSTRERELVALVLEGLDTRELATRMFISAYIVKDHLKSVSTKPAYTAGANSSPVYLGKPHYDHEWDPQSETTVRRGQKAVAGSGPADALQHLAAREVQRLAGSCSRQTCQAPAESRGSVAR